MQKEDQSVGRSQIVKSYWRRRASFYLLYMRREGSVLTASLKIL